MRVMADLDILADWMPEASAAFPRSHRALLADRYDVVLFDCLDTYA